MSRKLNVAYLAHSLRSDWNNGNAHFLRGLLRSVAALGSEVRIFEPCHGWSINHLREESVGECAIRHFHESYPDLSISCYADEETCDLFFWRRALRDIDVVVLHEWNPPRLADTLLTLRVEMGFRLLFHDTHHRASSSPAHIREFGVDRFDGILAFGNALRRVYRDQFGFKRVWTLHEAADTSVFYPLPQDSKSCDVVWVGNWGDDERSSEIREFLLSPAASLKNRRFAVHGVRYPTKALNALHDAGVIYSGYLPNLNSPAAYAAARTTIHIPRHQYAHALEGIPTIRVFEALACGIPLVCAPWSDTEHLFRKGDFFLASNSRQMAEALEFLLSNPSAAHDQAMQGLETLLSRHTCRHRAEQLLNICEEVLE